MKPIVRTLLPAFWCLLFLVAFDVALGRRLRYETPLTLQDHDAIARFLARD